MRKHLLLVVMLLLFITAVSGQTPQYLVFDMPDNEVAGLTKFEYKLNNGPYTISTNVTPLSLPDTTPGHKSFEIPLPILPRGDNIITVRACNSGGCSTDSSPFVVKLIGPPTNLRIKK